MNISILKKSPWSARIGILMVLIVVAGATLAPIVAPYGETEIIGDTWSSWSSEHYLGTDQLGRDIFTRLLYGARNTIALALIITLISFTIGILSGFFSALLGKWVDLILSRIVDIIMAFPTLIFALMMLSIFGTSIPVLIVLLALIDATRVFRLSRALAMDIKVLDFIEIARLRGERIWWIMVHETLPNTLTPLIAEFGMRFCFIFLFISALSFLGLGIQAPTADLGSMVRDNAGAITYGILTPLLPAATIAILTIGINLIADWILQRSTTLRGEH